MHYRRDRRLKIRLGALGLAALLCGCPSHVAQTHHDLEWGPFGAIGAGDAKVRHLDVKLLVKPDGPGLSTVDAQTDWQDGSQKVKVAAIVNGDGLVSKAPNAVFSIRGHSTRLARQKSYGIKLVKDLVWHGQRRINLNKCPYDLTRLRDKLSFDLLSALPEMTSLDTRFVQLTMDGKDYGLFTQIEEPGKHYLKSHSLNVQGSLYKAERFDFHRQPQVFKLKDEAGYDKVRFERELAIHGSEDHSPLVAMLTDVNNADMDINQVIDQHFDRRNYLTWLAVNILVQNLDTNEQNFYLYRPEESQRWQFLPWDYDGAWGWYDQPGAIKPGDPNFPARWQTAGVANWWGVALHRRFLENPANLAELTQRVDSLATKFFTRERLAALLKADSAAVQPLISHNPDLDDLPASGDAMAVWKREIDRLYTIVPKQQQRYHETLGWPMPFFLAQVQALGNSRTYTWEPSYSLVGDSIRYDFKLGRTPALEKSGLVVEKTALTGTSLTLDAPLSSGTYFWQVIARDAKDPDHAWQLAFDKVTDEGQGYAGIGSFSVP
jgi:spore coat protein H